MGKTKTKLMRDVSIVGTSTIGQFDFADPKWADFSMYEPWACAVHQAADDVASAPSRSRRSPILTSPISPRWVTSAPR